MKRRIFILVPSLHPAGPIKGAYALANILAETREVALVALKQGPGVDAYLHPDVQQMVLSPASGWRDWIHRYRALLEQAGGRRQVASISFCFSADMVNRFCRSQAVICSSIRGNLLNNYRMDYGWRGLLLAALHQIAVGKFDHVVAMNTPMARQISFFSRRKPKIIGNFVDEETLKQYRVPFDVGHGHRFVFLGSLSQRKQPMLLVRAIAKLIEKGELVRLDIIGNGPLHQKVADEIARLKLGHAISLHGHLSNPYFLLANADAMILPSLSEGISRAALEALHLGVPCVLRDVDGNDELIDPAYNGALFRSEEDLPDAMLAASRLSAGLENRSSLLPERYRQRFAAGQYLELIDFNL